MQAAVLVGGLGKRMGSLGAETPKPLLPVAGRPFLDWLLSNLERFGFDSVILLAGYLGEQVRDYARTREGDARLVCRIESRPEGTGGSLCRVREMLDEEFFVFNGDSLFDFNYLDLVARTPRRSQASLALRRVDDATRYGSVQLRGEQIVAFHEKGARGGALISGGVYYLRRGALDSLTSGSSLERDLFPVLAGDGRLSGLVYEGFFIDIGVPEDYARAQRALPAAMRRAAVFLDRDGTLNRDTGYVHSPEEFEWLPGAVETIRTLNDLGYLVIVVTNQAGVARGYYSEEDVQRLHQWMNRELRRTGAHVDAFYYCPHHPDQGQGSYRRECDCRKPKPGLILRAAQEWNVAVDRSFGVGDAASDAGTFAAAGVTNASSLERLRRMVREAGDESGDARRLSPTTSEQ